MIAVRQDSQGSELGTALTRGAVSGAPQGGPAIARAAIRVENVVSQRAFEKADFTTDAETRSRFLWEPMPGRQERERTAAAGARVRRLIPAVASPHALHRDPYAGYGVWSRTSGLCLPDAPTPRPPRAGQKQPQAALSSSSRLRPRPPRRSFNPGSGVDRQRLKCLYFCCRGCDL